MSRTAETAPVDVPILVWVADINHSTGNPVGWRMGRCNTFRGKDPRLYGEGLNGNWNIPYWHPLPDDPDKGRKT